VTLWTHCCQLVGLNQGHLHTGCHPKSPRPGDFGGSKQYCCELWEVHNVYAYPAGHGYHFKLPALCRQARTLLPGRCPDSGIGPLAPGKGGQPSSNSSIACPLRMEVQEYLDEQVRTPHTSRSECLGRQQARPLG
jgi:hypothetical protein